MAGAKLPTSYKVLVGRGSSNLADKNGLETQAEGAMTPTSKLALLKQRLVESGGFANQQGGSKPQRLSSKAISSHSSNASEYLPPWKISAHSSGPPTRQQSLGTIGSGGLSRQNSDVVMMRPSDRQALEKGFPVVLKREPPPPKPRHCEISPQQEDGSWEHQLAALDRLANALSITKARMPDEDSDNGEEGAGKSGGRPRRSAVDHWKKFSDLARQLELAESALQSLEDQSDFVLESPIAAGAG